MDGNFWKVFSTLFGVGVAVTIAKYMKSKSKKSIAEVAAECIITGFFSCGATAVWIFYPELPVMGVVGVGALGAILGVNFFSDTLEKFIGKWTNKDG